MNVVHYEMRATLFFWMSQVYLPPYSPDLSPIELAWSKIKAYLRKKAARTFEQLQQAICEAFASITQADLLAWFEHCGYCN